ncbi:hypothetical protein KAR34_08075 [bacterium]|nr:hypothetical protein [bacterium]
MKEFNSSSRLSFAAMPGYLPDDGAQHKTVVDVTTAFLGEKYQPWP